MSDDDQLNPSKESGYLTDFEDCLFSDIATNLRSIAKDSDSCNSPLLTVNFDGEAHGFIDRPTLGNVFYPKLHNFERISSVAEFKINLRNSLECKMDQESKMEFLGDLVTKPAQINMRRSQSVDLFDSSSEDETRLQSPDIFSESSEDEDMPDQPNPLEPIVSIIEEPRRREGLIGDVEKFMIKLMQDLVSDGNAIITMVNCAKWENCELSKGILTRKEPSQLIYRNVNLKSLKSRYHFAMIMHILSEIYHLLISGSTCTERELYYDDPELTESQLNVKSALRDICSILNASPWELGILSSPKGLIAGAIKMHLSNNLVIDCCMYDGATLIPGDMQAITFLETTAKFVLIIEKDTIFEKLLKQNILLNLKSDVILITGKGYPDLSTRLMVKKLWIDFRLPIYALVDADPFGIEIMLVYRFGSRTMVLNSDSLACPQIRWIGIQPSEIDLLAIPSLPQSKEDKKKVIELLQRSYISAEIRNELEILYRLDRKAEIEGVASFSANFLVFDYIPNKIKRNLII